MQHDFTTGSVWKKLLWFTLPIFGANLLQAMYGTVDLLVVGWFSSASSVSAVSTGSMTMQTITGIITGLTMGCTVLLGQNIGKKDERAAARTVTTALWLFLAVGLVLTVLVASFAEPVAVLMNAPEEALAETTGYIRICGLGIICIFLFNALSGIFRGIGDSRTPLILMGIACAGNVAGDLLLSGLFRMGASGAAIATVAAQGVSVFCAFLMIRRRGFGFTITRADIRPARREAGLLLKYGLPIAAQEALTGVSFMTILAILNGFGLIASAGVGVAEKITGLMFLVPGAFMSSVSAFSAQNVGAGEYGRARHSMRYGMLISFGIGLVMFLVSFFRGDLLAGLFTDDAGVIAAAADFLCSYSIDCVLVSFNFCMMGYFNGNGKTAFVAAQGILCTFLVRIPVSYFMSRIPGASLFMVGFATPLATVMGILMDVVYLILLERRHRGGARQQGARIAGQQLFCGTKRTGRTSLPYGWDARLFYRSFESKQRMAHRCTREGGCSSCRRQRKAGGRRQHRWMGEDRRYSFLPSDKGSALSCLLRRHSAGGQPSLRTKSL